MSTKLKTIALTKKDLANALEDNRYWKDQRLLMPKSKAFWILENERIAEDDFCAMLCLDDTDLASYVLVIPDLIQTNATDVEKLYWLQEWWVGKKYQNTVVPSYLFNFSLKKIKNRLLIESNANNAENFFKSQFKDLHKKTRYVIFFYLEETSLINKFSWLKYFKLILTFLNRTVLKFIHYRQQRKIQKRLNSVYFEYLNTLDTETWNFLKPRCANDFVLKTRNYIDWQIDNDQFTQTPISNKFPFRFSTTGFSNNIHEHSLKVLKDGEIIGFISYLFNMVEFNVRYFIPKEEKYYDSCVDVLIWHCLKHKASYIITDDSALTEAIQNSFFKLYTYKTTKTSRIHKACDVNFNLVNLTDRDGRFH